MQQEEEPLFVGGMSRARIILKIGWLPVLGYLFFFALISVGSNPNSAYVVSGAEAQDLPESAFAVSTIFLVVMVVWLLAAKRYLVYETSL